MQILEQCLGGLKYGRPQRHTNLTAYPLLVIGSPAPGYVTLAAAIAAGYAAVKEVSDAGSVPCVLLENSGPNAILVLDGEELIGAKQNRVANCTILAPAHETTRIPVSCVESGRWSYDSDAFGVSEQAQFMEGRRAKMENVSAALRANGRSRDADQAEVWDRIRAKAERMQARSRTNSMAEIFARHERTVRDYVAAFAATDGQVGAVFAIGGRVEGLELFDADRTFAELMAKIVRSYAIDALERPREEYPLDLTAAPRFVRRIARAHAETYPAVGLGTDVRLRGHGVIAAGLVHEDRVVHLAAFAAPGDELRGDGERSDRLESFLARRQRMRRAA